MNPDPGCDARDKKREVIEIVGVYGQDGEQFVAMKARIGYARGEKGRITD